MIIPTKQIAAVAFDIDGTLYPNFRMYRESWSVVARNYALFRAFGRARRLVRTERPLTDLHRRTVEIAAEILRRDPEEVAAAIQREIYGSWESVLSRVPLYPGARELVGWLRSQDIPTAALSDFPVERKIALLGIQDLWDVAFSSEETGYLKPHPEPFLRLIAELGFPPEEILYVGNSYRYDVVGARSCGLQTAHITRSPARHMPADFSFFRFRELQRWLEPRLKR